jgi:hypothetical protein
MSVSYRVKSPGFHGGQLYHPQGKRTVLTVDKKFEKTPSWLVLITGKVDKADKDAGLDRVKIKAAMLEMIKKKEGCSPEGVPNMAPLKVRTSLKFGQAVRDELMAEIEKEKTDQIDKDSVTFTGDQKPSNAVTTL